jgi:cytochrome c556
MEERDMKLKAIILVLALACLSAATAAAAPKVAVLDALLPE